MPRERRAREPRDVPRIVGRAHDARAIFAGDEDRGDFTDRLRRVFVPGAADLVAWVALILHDTSNCDVRRARARRSWKVRSDPMGNPMGNGRRG